MKGWVEPREMADCARLPLRRAAPASGLVQTLPNPASPSLLLPGVEPKYHRVWKE